jgi:hypothetical protein
VVVSGAVVVGRAAVVVRAGGAVVVRRVKAAGEAFVPFPPPSTTISATRATVTAIPTEKTSHSHRASGMSPQ